MGVAWLFALAPRWAKDLRHQAARDQSIEIDLRDHIDRLSTLTTQLELAVAATKSDGGGE